MVVHQEGSKVVTVFDGRPVFRCSVDLAHRQIHNRRYVFIYGSRENAKLLSLLGKCGNCRKVVRIVKPPSDGSDSSVVSHYFRMYAAGEDSAARLGHTLTPEVAASYALISKAYSKEPLDKYLVNHPAWPVISFVNGLRAVPLTRLIAEIIDPRWFRHPVRTNRSSKLNAYLGLRPSSIRRALSRPVDDDDQYTKRARLALLSWTGATLLEDEPFDLNDPGNFLWRIYAHKGGGTRGVLAATKRFVRMLQDGWIHGLKTVPGGWFDPYSFFFSHDDAESMTYHLQQGGT